MATWTISFGHISYPSKMSKVIFEYEMKISGMRVFAYGRGSEVYGVAIEGKSEIKPRLAKLFEILTGKPNDRIPQEFDNYKTNGEINCLIPKFQWGTDFQQSVWTEIGAIPIGRTTTYSEIARKINKPKAARAVGQAVGANPIPIIVPCHRVLAKNGVGGFSSGLANKLKLLAHEGISLAEKN